MGSLTGVTEKLVFTLHPVTWDLYTGRRLKINGRRRFTGENMTFTGDSIIFMGDGIAATGLHAIDAEVGSEVGRREGRREGDDVDDDWCLRRASKLTSESSVVVVGESSAD